MSPSLPLPTPAASDSHVLDSILDGGPEAVGGCLFWQLVRVCISPLRFLSTLSSIAPSLCFSSRSSLAPSPPAPRWAILLCILLSQGVGLLIGATVSNVKSCLTIAAVTMLTLMLVGGFYVKNIPVWIDWMKYVSYIYWGWNLLLKVSED